MRTDHENRVLVQSGQSSEIFHIYWFKTVYHCEAASCCAQSPVRKRWEGLGGANPFGAKMEVALTFDTVDKGIMSPTAVDLRFVSRFLIRQEYRTGSIILLNKKTFVSFARLEWRILLRLFQDGQEMDWTLSSSHQGWNLTHFKFHTLHNSSIMADVWLSRGYPTTGCLGTFFVQPSVKSTLFILLTNWFYIFFARKWSEN